MFTRPEAAPESAAGTPVSDVVVNGTNTSPHPEADQQHRAEDA
jgi:hypothetical protein